MTKRIKASFIPIEKYKTFRGLGVLAAPWGTGYPYTVNVPKHAPVSTQRYTRKGKSYEVDPYSRRPGTKKRQSTLDQKFEIEQQALDDFENLDYLGQNSDYSTAFSTWWQEHRNELMEANPHSTEENVIKKLSRELNKRIGKFIKSNNKTYEKILQKEEKRWLKEQESLAKELGIDEKVEYTDIDNYDWNEEIENVEDQIWGSL